MVILALGYVHREAAVKRRTGGIQDAAGRNFRKCGDRGPGADARARILANGATRTSSCCESHTKSRCVPLVWPEAPVHDFAIPRRIVDTKDKRILNSRAIDHVQEVIECGGYRSPGVRSEVDM